AALLIFPVCWLINEYLELGEFLLAFSYQERGTSHQHLGIVSTFRLLYEHVSLNCGAALVLVALAGMAYRLLLLRKDDLTRGELFFASWSSLYWLVWLILASKRGGFVYDRYLLFGLIVFPSWAGLALSGLVDKLKFEQSGLRWNALQVVTI